MSARPHLRAARIVIATLAVVLANATTAATAAPVSPMAEVTGVSPTDTPAQIIAKAASVTPSSRQLAWQRLEQTAFLHFGVNTYDDRQVGTGTENPNIFQPTGLNTDQWVLALKNAGFKQAILTAKHHDGFLLFPSKYSSFSVASSSWAGGGGDVVNSFTASAHKYGMKVGIYISPADLHEAQPGGRFANGSGRSSRTIPSDPSEIVNGRTFQVTADDYNAYFMNTLYELLTRYGTVDEVWWDGANPTGANEPYDYTSWIQIVRALQPGAVMFQDIDVRWVGNEDGVGRPSEWSPLPYVGDAATAADRFVPPTTDPGAPDKASDAVLGQRRTDGSSAWNFLRWSPAECDTSMMNGGYFWFPGVTARSPAELSDIYYTSVGRNCQLLLNVPPDRDGVFDQTMLDALSAYGNTITSTFSQDLAAGATASNDSGTANAGGHPPNLAVDGNLDTSWQPTGTTGGLVLDLGGTRTFDVVGVQEDLNIGMRTENFAVDAWNGTGWSQVASDTTIGHKKLIRLGSPVSTDRVRLRITAARAAPPVASVGLFRRPSGGSTPTGPIRSGIAGKCADVNGGSNADETHVQIWDCNGTAAQNWTVAGDGTLRMFGKCMDIYGGASVGGSRVQLYTCNGGGNQQWRPVNGTLVNPQSGRCLDDPGFSATNGTQLVIWDCNGGANQRWTLPS
jgi:alpha-L-fucosidase